MVAALIHTKEMAVHGNQAEERIFPSFDKEVDGEQFSVSSSHVGRKVYGIDGDHRA